MLKQFTLSENVGMTLIEGNFKVGASGAVSTLRGTGVAAVTRLAAGIYQVNFTSAYNRFLGFNAWVQSPVSGTSVAVTSLTPNTTYVITSLGTTTTAQWQAAGLALNITPAVGVAFFATATSAGTGTVALSLASGSADVEVLGDPSMTINAQRTLATLGATAPSSGYVILQCLSATSSSVTTPVATDLASGSTLAFEFWLRKSSVTGAGGV